MRLEKDYEKLELKFKKVTNEKFEESNELQKKVKILQEKLGKQGYCYGTTNNTIFYIQLLFLTLTKYFQ